MFCFLWQAFSLAEIGLSKTVHIPFFLVGSISIWDSLLSNRGLMGTAAIFILSCHVQLTLFWCCFWYTNLVGISLLSAASKHDESAIFCVVLVVIWCGSLVISLNAVLLGGHMYVLMNDASLMIVVSITIVKITIRCGVCVSICCPQRSVLQSISIIGYCLAPMDLAALGCLLWGNKIFKISLVAGAYLWSILGNDKWLII